MTEIALYNRHTFNNFFDEVYNSVNDDKDHIIRITGATETQFKKYLDIEFYDMHIKRMQKLSNIEVRVLTTERVDSIRLKYATYKCIEEKYFESIPTYIYNNKLSHIMWDPFNIITISSPELAEANAKSFDFIWNQAK